LTGGSWPLLFQAEDGVWLVEVLEVGNMIEMKEYSSAVVALMQDLSKLAYMRLPRSKFIVFRMGSRSCERDY
jgi:hypothetical protein